MFFENKNLKTIGQISFYIGTFFLASALPLSIIFFLLTVFISLKVNKEAFFKDKFNIFLLLCSCIMIFSSLNSIFFLDKVSSENNLNIIIGLLNWIPFFILFITSKMYLRTAKQRQIFSKYLLAGTIPVLFSCILQSWFKIYGPFETFYGLIVWFQKDPEKINGISGLFSNQNYTGAWLTTCFAFSIFIFKEIKFWNYNKFFFLLVSIFIVHFSLLTTSRNAFICLIFISLMLTKVKIIKYFSVVPIFIFFLHKINDYLSINFLSEIYSKFPSNILNLSFIFNFKNYQFERLEIYKISSKLISQNPILGWGGSTFSKNYQLNGGAIDTQHAHNIVLEIAHNYGIPVALILSFIVILMLFKVGKIFYKNRSDKSYSSIDKYWFIATIVPILSHMNDVTYYDGKISILIWLLLTGLKCIIEEHEMSNNFYSSQDKTKLKYEE